MKVKDLIKALSEMKEDAEVVFEHATESGMKIDYRIYGVQNYNSIVVIK